MVSRQLVPREKHRRFVKEFMLDLNATNAASRAGFSHWNAGANLMQRPAIKQAIAIENDSRLARLEIQADDVLRALLRQAQRLETLLGYASRWTEIYDESGNLKHVSTWPDWAANLITGLDTEIEYSRSNDGVDAAAEGDKRGGWDASGITKKVKRESTLAIERELRECWKTIGNHVKVKAFPTPEKGGDTNILIVTAANAREIEGARRRMQHVVKVNAENE